MDQTAVKAAMETLWSQSRTLSAGNIRKVLGYGSLRDILTCRNALLSLMEEIAEPLASCDVGHVEVFTALPVERPTALCWQCGTSSWFEWDVGIWRCRLCGVDPPT
jgi:hypothetical protein